MATAVLPSLQGLTLDREIMPPSPISQNSSRHGRSKHGGSVVKGKGRGRGYSVIDERDVLISKALSWILKRTIGEGEEDEGEGRVIADGEGWVGCEEVLRRPNMELLKVTFSELQALVASPTSRSRFSVKLGPSAEPSSSDASDFLIRVNPSQTNQTLASATTALTPISINTADLPDLIVYETSYANYPLILASGSIKRAGGQTHLQFASIKVQEDGTEVRSSADVDVSIYINLRDIMESNDEISWFRAENGNVLTEGDASGSIQKKFWKRAVARRADIGVLFEDGEVRKEVPIGLRGKGVKGKKGTGKGKGKGFMKARSEDEGTSSD